MDKYLQDKYREVKKESEKKIPPEVIEMSKWINELAQPYMNFLKDIAKEDKKMMVVFLAKLVATELIYHYDSIDESLHALEELKQECREDMVKLDKRLNT